MASLRRSIFGSLKSAGDRFSRSTKSTFRTESSLSGRITPSPSIPRHSNTPSEPPPELDRQIDLLFTETYVQREFTFDQILREDESVIDAQWHNEILWQDSGGDYVVKVVNPDDIGTMLFTLPPKLRRQIYSYCFEDEQRTISLSPNFATKELFEEGYFASPWNVLDPVSGALQSFHALRKDLLRYFWTQFRFHVTLNMFSGPTFSPLSHVWLKDYLNIIQDLTLEVDLTRLGGSALKNAAVFGYDNQRVERMVVDIVAGLLNRDERLPMA